MNLLSTILDRLNQRIAVGNIFDQIYGLSELSADGNDKAWIHYIGNGQAIPVTNFDAKQGTLFWSKRGKISVAKIETFKLAGCKSLYETKFSLSANAVVRKSHLPCDSADAQDWIASRVLRLISGTDPDFKVAIGVVSYEVVPSGYTNEIKSLPANYEWASVTIDVDINVVSGSEDGCYDTCQSGDIPLPDFEPCTPCLTEVAVDGVTITGNGTEADPLVAIGGGGGTPLRTQDEGVNVSTNTTTLNFTGAGVTASLTSPGVVEVNVPGGGAGGGVTAVTGTAPIASSGGATPDISISQADGSTDGYLSSADWATFDGKQDVLSAGTGISITGTTIDNTAPDQIVVLTAGTNIGVTGTYPNFTINNTATSLPPSGSAGGDLSGTYPNPEVHKVHGVDFQAGTPSANDVWVYGGSPAKWQHQGLTASQLPQLDATKIANGSVSNAEFEHLDGTTSPIQTQLNGKFATPTGTTSQYLRGDGSLATFPTIPSGTVTSVSASVPSPASPALSVSVTNPTSTPAIAITANGTTAQYIRGDGSLATLPSSGPVVYKSTTDGTAITNIASEQISASQLIPANTFAAGDVIRISWRTRKTGTATGSTFKLYINSSASLAGATQMGLLSINASQLTSQMQRTLAIKSATNTEAYSNVGVNNDFTFTSVAVISANINWASDQYIIFMCQLGAAVADTLRTSFYTIEKL